MCFLFPFVFQLFMFLWSCLPKRHERPLSAIQDSREISNIVSHDVHRGKGDLQSYWVCDDNILWNKVNICVVCLLADKYCRVCLFDLIFGCLPTEMIDTGVCSAGDLKAIFVSGELLHMGITIQGIWEIQHRIFMWISLPCVF